MAKKSTIHQLIHSMDTAEKGFFKKYASRVSKSNGKQYVRLFDAISKQKEYDESKLLAYFKDDNLAKHFAVTKHYLYHIILESLEHYHKGKNIHLQLLSHYNQVIILHHRRLYQQALKHNEKGLKLAREKGIKFMESRFLHYKIIIWRDSQSLDNLTGDLDELWLELKETNQASQEQLNLDFISSKRLYTIRKGLGKSEQNKEYLSWKKMAENMGEENCYNNTDLSKFIQFKGHIAEIEKEHDVMFEWSKRGVELEFKDLSLPTNAIINCQNILTKSVRLMYYDEMPYYIEKIREVPKTQGIKIQKQTTAFANIRADAFELTYLFQKDKKEECLQLIESYSKTLMEYKHSDAFIWQLAINALMGLYLWNYGSLSEAEDKANYIINETKSTLLPSYQFTARAVSIAIHFEKNNYRLIEYKLEKLIRYARKENIEVPLCKLIISTFRKLMKAVNKKEKKQIIQRFEEESHIDRFHYDIFSGYRDLATVMIARLA